jgi:hypothetical protein
MKVCLPEHYDGRGVKEVAIRHFDGLRLGEYVNHGSYGTVFGYAGNPKRCIKVYLLPRADVKPTTRIMRRFAKERPDWAMMIYEHGYKSYDGPGAYDGNNGPLSLAYYVGERLERVPDHMLGGIEPFFAALRDRGIDGWDFGSQNVMWSRRNTFKVIDLDQGIEWPERGK